MPTPQAPDQDLRPPSAVTEPPPGGSLVFSDDSADAAAHAVLAAPRGETPLAVGAPVDWPLRQQNPVRRGLNALERLSLAVERPIARWVRDGQWNPLYHTGTITLFALVIILVTGVYLTLFYQFGFTQSYVAVAKIESNFLGRFMRGLHRYASVLAIIGALLHGWRTFFMDRFRGPRWLAWVTGIVLVVFVWGAGLTGYWLIFDERASLFNQTLLNTLKGSRAGVGFLYRFMLGETAENGWIFVLGVLTVHLLLSALIGLFFYLHIKRLRRAKVLPPRYWMALLGVPLLLATLFLPVGMLGPADPGRMPAATPLDIFLLWYAPAALHLSPLVFWGGVAVILVLLGAVPWLLRRKRLEPAQVDVERCTGCTLCAADCPYRAIAMIEREPGSAHKFLAVIDPKLCVSCGICVGSCPPLAISLGERAPELLWQQTAARAAAQGGVAPRVVFACERHAQQAARPFLATQDAQAFGGAASSASPTGNGKAARVEVIPVPCIGALHPDLVREAWRAGAASVEFVGCPTEDCANREGNVWMQARLDRDRLPKLRRELQGAAIATHWLPPNDFSRALKQDDRAQPATAYALKLNQINWRAALPALLLLAATMALSIAGTHVPYRAWGQDEARVQIALVHRSGYPVTTAGDATIVHQSPKTASAAPVRLLVELDGQVALEKTYPERDLSKAIQIVEQLPASAGQQHLRVSLFDQIDQTAPTVLVDKTITLERGQILQVAFQDARLGADPLRGQRLFNGSELGLNTGCPVCHSLKPDVRLVGPSLAGVATRATTRVSGMSAEDYLMQSLVTPNAYVVEGFQAGQMRPDLAQVLTEQQLQDLVAFLMTLH